jgi:hypothetical protein
MSAGPRPASSRAADDGSRFAQVVTCAALVSNLAMVLAMPVAFGLTFGPASVAVVLIGAALAGAGIGALLGRLMPTSLIRRYDLELGALMLFATIVILPFAFFTARHLLAA